jgi:hypothetical protein
MQASTYMYKLSQLVTNKQKISFLGFIIMTMIKHASLKPILRKYENKFYVFRKQKLKCKTTERTHLALACVSMCDLRFVD